MEKCTFCVQRIRKAVDKAESERRSVADGEVQPACVQTCPANALIFGQIDDPTSQVSRAAASGRAVKLLEELGTLPRITYLKGGSDYVRNS
jgi:molybdopterin-containing oxidoreductase family iron-sulfur binding subunit